MAFDGMITKAITTELSYSILEGKINKIYQPNKNEILLGIYAGGKNLALAICIDSTNYRMHLTTNAKPNPMNAANFCMLLRKHIIGYRIKQIQMNGLERIVTIHLEGYNELNDLTNKKLIIELMGKHSNIILVNDKDFIIESLRHLDITSHSYRDILPAHAYIYPQNEKVDFLAIPSFEQFKQVLSTGMEEKNLDKLIANTFVGFSYSFVNSLLQKLQIDSIIYTEEQLEKVYHYLVDFIHKIQTNEVSITIITNEKGKKDYILDTSKKQNPLFNNFVLDDYYFQKEQQDNFTSYRNQVLKLILTTLSKYTNRLKSINQKLEDCENRDRYQLYGELITANLYRIPNNHNQKEITLENYYDNNSPIKIPLDNTISVSNNAKKFFKKYTKLKNALEIVSLQKKDTERELDYIGSVIYELENSKTIADVNEIYSEIADNNIFKDFLHTKKEKNLKKGKKTKDKEAISMPKEYIVDGFTILVGKNNKQNDYLTTKLADKTDLWFHTKDIHGSHVILKNNNEKEITNPLLETCASLAAYHSKAKLSSNVPVDYCYVKYVKKPSGSKPGMVIYTNNKTLYVNPKNLD